MSAQREHNWPKIAGLAVLAALAVAAVILGLQVTQLAGRTAEEARTTPTPVPVAGNVMQVTIDPSQPTPEPILRAGSEGEEVKELQARLQTLGYYTGEIDGQYGPGTREAVRLFQEQNGLGADGIFGGETRAALYSAQARPITLTPSPDPTATAAPTIAGAAAGFREDGLPLLVNQANPLPEGYQPQELVNMTDYCDGSLVKIKGSGIEGERVAVDALLVMLQAAHAEGITVWQVSAGYRSVAYQQQLLDDKIYEYRQQGFSGANARSAALKTVAAPGSSEHHTGLAFDITVPGVAFKGTQQAQWLAENCWDYGFILRYQADKEAITGITAEPWHVRYVGVEHALIMRDENLCLEEYIDLYGRM